MHAVSLRDQLKEQAAASSHKVAEVLARSDAEKRAMHDLTLLEAAAREDAERERKRADREAEDAARLRRELEHAQEAARAARAEVRSRRRHGCVCVRVCVCVFGGPTCNRHLLWRDCGSSTRILDCR